MPGSAPTPIVKCPSCQKQVAWIESSRWRPFCSQRCRMVDLGAWFSGERAIAGDPVDPVDAVDASRAGDPGEAAPR